MHRPRAAFLPFCPLPAVSSGPPHHFCPYNLPTFFQCRTPISLCITPPSQSSASSLSIQFLENNSFLLSNSTTTILLDPWLYDDLVFLSPSFFRSRKPRPRSTALDYTRLDLSKVSFILLTQHLADHAHIPTLRRLPKSIPVIAPPEAVSLLRNIGFANITVAKYNQRIEIAGLSVLPLRGSIVGPPWSAPQLAYVLEFPSNNSSPPISIYHEPHGNHDFEALSAYRKRLTAVMAPAIGTSIPALAEYALVNDYRSAVELCKFVQPRYCVSFDNSSGEQSGALTRVLQVNGSLEEFERAMRRENELRDMEILHAGSLKDVIVISNEQVRDEATQA